MAASTASSFLFSLLVALLLFASMQIFRNQIASSQPLTIAGGFVGSLVFVSLLTAVSNFEMNTFSPNFQAKVFPEVVGCLFVSMLGCGLVHRVCVTTCFIFSMIALYYINRISVATYAAPTAFVATKKQK